jgi:hypothetical protein
MWSDIWELPYIRFDTFEGAQPPEAFPQWLSTRVTDMHVRMRNRPRFCHLSLLSA